MTIGVLCSNPSCPGWHVESLVRGAGRRGLEIVALDYRALAASVGLSAEDYRGGASARENTRRLRDLDAVVVRAMPAGSLEQVIYRMDVLNRLEALGTRVINPPRAIESAVDKFLATARMSAAGVPVPPTSAGESVDAALEAFRALGGDVVIKPLFGSEGNGVERVASESVAVETFRELAGAGAVIYQQQFVDHGGRDLRILTVGDRVVAAMARRSSDWRTNVARGGAARAHDPTPAEADLALAASRAVGTVVAGVDIVESSSGARFVLEVNSSPGWRALERVSGVDVAGALLDALVSRA